MKSKKDCIIEFNMAKIVGYNKIFEVIISNIEDSISSKEVQSCPELMDIYQSCINICYEALMTTSIKRKEELYEEYSKLQHRTTKPMQASLNEQTRIK
jgi:hypothetical protein